MIIIRPVATTAGSNVWRGNGLGQPRVISNKYNNIIIFFLTYLNVLKDI